MTSLSTKRAFITSVISLLVCVTMLIGSTFAWFTDNDSIKSGNITAGTLDIEIVDANGNEKIDELAFLDVNGDTPDFWEPGATFHTEQFAIKNNGNLNLKFKLDIKGAKISDGKLNEVISFTLVNVKDGSETALTTNDNNTILMQDIFLAPEATSDLFYIKAHMDEMAGNEYQKLTLAGLNIVVYATQVNGESDINGDNYDEDADYGDNVVIVSNEEEFLAAFAALEEGQIINLTNDIDLTGESWTPVANKGFTLNGNEHTITGMSGALVSRTAALSYTVKNVTFDSLTVNNSGDYAGLISYADTCAYILMDNVHIVNSAITSADYAGAFVGYTSGYSNNADGAVNASHNFVNCSVKETTITSTGDGSIGAAIGHCGANDATTTIITGFVAENVTLAQTSEARADKVGAVIGTVNIGDYTEVEATATGCTGNGAELTKLVGRFVPNAESDKLFINGVDTPEFDGK